MWLYQILNYTEVSLQFLINKEDLRKSNYVSILQKSWGFYSITYLDYLLLCYVTGRIND